MEYKTDKVDIIHEVFTNFEIFRRDKIDHCQFWNSVRKMGHKFWTFVRKVKVENNMLDLIICFEYFKIILKNYLFKLQNNKIMRINRI